MRRWTRAGAGRSESGRLGKGMESMEVNQIRYFLNLADTLNFTEAAMRSGVSQPTLTRAIQRLEQELGGTLLYRDGKDSRLTAFGRDIRSEFAAMAESEQRVRCARPPPLRPPDFHAAAITPASHNESAPPYMPVVASKP